MTKQEQAKMRKLEIENEQFRIQLDKAGKIYREQLYELVDLRSRLQSISEKLADISSEAEA